MNSQLIVNLREVFLSIVEFSLRVYECKWQQIFFDGQNMLQKSRTVKLDTTLP